MNYTKFCSETSRLRLVIPLRFKHFSVISMDYKSTDHGKLLSVR